MTNDRLAVVLVSMLGSLVIGCNKDAEVASFVEANDALATAMAATTTPEEARSVFDARKDALGELFSDIQSARNFQVSDASRESLTDSVMRGVTAICALQIRGVFDTAKAAAYRAICDEYALLLGATAPSGSASEQEQLARDLARDLERAREEARDGSRLTMFACVSLDQYQSGLASASEGELRSALEEYVRLCTIDGPLSRMEHAVSAAEIARAASPSQRVLSECYSAHWTSAARELAQTPAGASDPRLATLRSRWAAACPGRE